MSEPVQVVDYVAIVRFLLEPLVETPETLRIDSELLANGSRVFLRVAFEGSDKGRVMGRGGRNIQAIRTILMAVGQPLNQRVHLDVFGTHSNSEHDGGDGRSRSHSRDSGHSNRPRPRSRPSRNRS